MNILGAEPRKDSSSFGALLCADNERDRRTGDIFLVSMVTLILASTALVFVWSWNSGKEEAIDGLSGFDLTDVAKYSPHVPSLTPASPTAARVVGRAPGISLRH